MTNPETRRARLAVGPTDLPEDVRAELDTEDRRRRAEPAQATAAQAVPEDVLGERDLEARVAGEQIRQQIAEGTPPADEDSEI